MRGQWKRIDSNLEPVPILGNFCVSWRNLKSEKKNQKKKTTDPKRMVLETKIQGRNRKLVTSFLAQQKLRKTCAVVKSLPRV